MRECVELSGYDEIVILIQSGRVNDTPSFSPSRPFVLSRTQHKQRRGKTITDTSQSRSQQQYS